MPTLDRMLYHASEVGRSLTELEERDMHIFDIGSQQLETNTEGCGRRGTSAGESALANSGVGTRALYTTYCLHSRKNQR